MRKAQARGPFLIGRALAAVTSPSIAKAARAAWRAFARKFNFVNRQTGRRHAGSSVGAAEAIPQHVHDSGITPNHPLDQGLIGPVARQGKPLGERGGQDALGLRADQLQEYAVRSNGQPTARCWRKPALEATRKD